LSFEHKFEYENDEVCFAYAIPYTFTQLRTYIQDLLHDSKTSKYIDRQILCKTVSGLQCDYLIISNNKQSAGETGTTAGCTQNNKKLVIFTARVHPGESVSSYMMKGIIDFLTSEHQTAIILRENFIFLIIPMLNPDGVVYGNYRCCSTGSDLNRKYLQPSKTFHPTIYYTKKIIRKLQREHTVSLYIDFHGHSGAYFSYLKLEKDKIFLHMGIPILTSQKFLERSRIF